MQGHDPNNAGPRPMSFEHMLPGLLGIGAGMAGQIPGLVQSPEERRLRQMAAGRGTSAAQTMLQQQAGANARNAMSVAAAQPGGLGLLQGLRSAEEGNRGAMERMSAIRAMEQQGAIEGAHNMRQQRTGGWARMGMGAAQTGGALGAQFAVNADAARNDPARQAVMNGLVMPNTQLAPPTFGQR